MLYSSIAAKDLPGEVADREQHNPINRLLSSARLADAAGHLEDFVEGFLDQRNTEHREIDHAQRVLLRLREFKKEN